MGSQTKKRQASTSGNHPTVRVCGHRPDGCLDTVSHDTLIYKIVGSSLPLAITRLLSCYLRGRQAATSFRGTKSSTRIVRTGVPQGSRLSLSLFNYYIADMPKPTPPVKRVCYAEHITVWATGSKIPQLESMINNYLRDVSIYLKDNSLLISAPKSTVTLFTPNKHQFQMHPDITLEDVQLPLERSPKILGVILDPSISFHKHFNYVPDRIDKRNNMLKTLVGSSWGQDKETDDIQRIGETYRKLCSTSLEHQRK